jgi:succinyl-CoA synthetase beta subunit/citryl-CoA synthetase large subunit
MDATMAEINPLILTKEQKFFCADSRIEIDDDALVRQKGNLERFNIPLREEKEREPTELEIKARGIDQLDHRGVAGRVVEFDGDIALIIGGGGASLTVFDAILRYGGKPANYCEIGGNPTVKKVQKLTELLLSKKGIKGVAVITNVLSNTRVDLVARGVIKGMLARGIDPSKFPVVFRVPGSWEEEGFKILEKYGIKYFTRDQTMDEAAKYIVDLLKKEA